MIRPNEMRDHATSEHKRGCSVYMIECNCGHDKETERMLRAAAKRIDELEATNRGYRERFALERKDPPP